MSAAAINAAVAAAIAANESGDVATALLKLETAKMLLASTPTVRRGGVGAEAIEWDRESIDSLIRDLRRKQAAAAGVQKTLIEFAQPVLSDEE